MAAELPVGRHPVDRAHRRAVDHAVDHILDNLATSLDLAGIAAEVGYSPWHFQRIFRQTMGESPAAFVARARVERAVAIARAEPQRTWQDIAWEVGFATPSRLSNAFRQRFGLRARTWDRTAPLAERVGAPAPVEVAPASLGGPMAVGVERVPPCRFVYRRVRDPYVSGNLATAWDEVASWCPSTSAPAPMLGMSWDDPATVPMELCRYDLGIVLDAAAPRPEGASERWMPSAWAAVIRVEGDLQAVDAAWAYLHRSWLPSAPYRRTALPSIERFHADPRPGWERWHLDCILPITPAR